MRGSACRPNRNGSLAVSACAPERSGYCACRHGHFTRKLTYAVAAVRWDSIRRRVLNTVQRCLVVPSYVHTVSLAAQAHLCVGTVVAHRLSRQLDRLHCKVGQPWWPPCRGMQCNLLACTAQKSSACLTAWQAVGVQAFATWRHTFQCSSEYTGARIWSDDSGSCILLHAITCAILQSSCATFRPVHFVAHLQLHAPIYR